MNLEDIMLSKISQTQKDKQCTIPLVWKIVQCIEVDKRAVVARGWVGGGGAHREGSCCPWVEVIGT